MGSLMDFTLSNARRFYSSTWKVLGFSGVKGTDRDFEIERQNIEVKRRDFD